VKTKHGIQTPQLPISPNDLFRHLKDRLGSYRHLKTITGVEISTLESWCISAPLDQVRALLKLLSALPQTQRHALLDSATLVLPRLDHHFLTGDKLVLARLKRIASKQSGITCVESISTYLRTFLASSIVNSAGGSNLTVFGRDIHSPDWSIPISGVQYLGVAENLLHVRKAAEQDLQIPSEAQVVFLNGLWAFFSDQQRAELLRSTHKYHLIICDCPRAFERTKAGGITHIVTAARNPALPTGYDDAQHMWVGIEELGSDGV